MTHLRWVTVIAVALVIAAGVGVALSQSGGDHESAAQQAAEHDGDNPAMEGEGEENEADDPDRNAAAHVGSKPGYEKHNNVTQFATLAATGWVGESKLAVEDTWEPTVAADPSAPYVYAMYNRYGVSCPKSGCPNPAMMIRVSSDGGASWGAEKQVCTCAKVQGQWDPVLATTSNGTVYGVWMNYNTIVFSKSIDHGANWSTPATVSVNSWSDKPWMGTSANGQDIYIAWESRSVFYATASHNAGASWSTPIVLNNDSSVYRYANGLAVLPNGTAVLADSKYPGGSAQSSGTVDIEIWRSTNGGASWTRNVVDHVFTGSDFRTSSTTTVAADHGATPTLVMEYSGATATGGNGHVWVRRSTDSGATWSAATQLANGSANASFPAVVGGAAGDFRLTWMDATGGAWNVYYSTSTNGGVSWSSGLDISDSSTGASYKSAAGFQSGYGDYDGIAITNLGKTVTVAGEGVDFTTGPGGIWMNRTQ